MARACSAVASASSRRAAGGGLVGRLALPFVGAAQLVDLRALAEHIGLAGQLALRRAGAGCSVDPQTGQGAPGSSEAARTAACPWDQAASSAASSAAARSRRPASRALRAGRRSPCRPLPRLPRAASAAASASEGRRRRLRPRLPVMAESSRTCSASSVRCAVARGLGGERRLGCARAAVRRLVVGHLGHLELEHRRCQLVAPVVHAGGRAAGAARPCARESISARTAAISAALGGERVGVGLRCGELVEPGGDALGRAQRGEGGLFGGRGRGRRRLGFGRPARPAGQPLADFVGARPRPTVRTPRASRRGLLRPRVRSPAPRL